jgi:hypothetical protein
MSDWAKPAFTPCAKEFINLVPTIKTEAKGVILQNPVNFVKGWINPTGVIVVENTPPSPVAKICDIRWVRHN